MNYGNRSVAYVHQLAGDDNDATIEQRAEDSDALIQQSGDHNTASINQREDSPPTENFSAQIWQSGDDGQSTIDQDGDNSWAKNDKQGTCDVTTIVPTGPGHSSGARQNGTTDRKTNQ